MPTQDTPRVIVLAGPNGAGKSTAAAALLPTSMTFVNADEVAKTLPDYPSAEADRLAGRMVLEQLDDLAARRASFAIETTLSGRSLAARIGRLRDSGYRFRLIFLWSPSSEFCIRRVASRVRSGGHHIPEDVIRRRREAGLKNFFALYRPIADEWFVYTAIGPGHPRRVAMGTMKRIEHIERPEVWRRVQEAIGNA